MFKIGSYWIYQDSVSQETDSVYITKMEDYQVEDEQIYGYCSFVGTRLYYYSTYYNKEEQQAFSVMCNATKLPWVYISSDLNVCFFWGVYYENGNERPIKKGDYISNTMYDSTYTNYTLLGNNYSQVKAFKERNSSSWNNFKQVFYTPHIGIIKKETNDGNVWQLLRYQVIQ